MQDRTLIQVSININGVTYIGFRIEGGLSPYAQLGAIYQLFCYDDYTTHQDVNEFNLADGWGLVCSCGALINFYLPNGKDILYHELVIEDPKAKREIEEILLMIHGDSYALN